MGAKTWRSSLEPTALTPAREVTPLLVLPHPREGAPPPPLGDRTTTVRTHLQAQKLQHKTKEFRIRYVQGAANVRRPTP